MGGGKNRSRRKGVVAKGLGTATLLLLVEKNRSRGSAVDDPRQTACASCHSSVPGHQRTLEAWREGGSGRCTEKLTLCKEDSVQMNMQVSLFMSQHNRWGHTKMGKMGAHGPPSAT